MAAGEYEYSKITDQFPELPTAQEKKLEKKNPQMPYRCVGLSGIGRGTRDGTMVFIGVGSDAGVRRRRRQPTHFANFPSSVIPARLLFEYHTNTVPTKHATVVILHSGEST